MSLKDIAEEYFSQINPIASRMYLDLNETKIAYEDLWPSLSEVEKEQLLNESIIKPEVLIKYSSTKTISKPKAEDQYAIKIVLEDNCSYRDEHSGPFSFRTQSQRNLHIFGNQYMKGKGSEDAKVILKPKMKHISIESKETERKSNHVSEVKENPRMLRRDTPFCSTLPKTGLDFLDNW